MNEPELNVSIWKYLKNMLGEKKQVAQLYI